MIGLLEALTPTVILILSALITVPVVALIRRGDNRHRSLIILWVIIPFILVGISLINLSREYYGMAGETPFINVSLIGGAGAALSSSFLIDAVSLYMASVYLIMALPSCIYSILYVGMDDELSGRYFALMFMVLGSVIAATFSGDLLTLFIFWEASAAGSCFLIVYGRRAESIEASLKYLVMIIIASGFIVFGLSIIYGIVGSLNFWAVREVLLSITDKRLLVAAFAFVACGYAIETAVVPFHMWLPDAYTAAPPSSAAFLSAIVDQASYYVFMRVLVYILTPPLILNWPPALGVFSALTMTVGNLFALAQSDVKRMISYVCVADIGYNLVAITSVKPIGVMGNLFFFFVGGMTTALAFMAIGVLNDMGLRSLEDLSGIGRKLPLTSLALIVAVLSFSGIPTFAGFMAKYLVFTAAIEAGMGWLAVAGVLNTVLQTAYLIRLIHYMFARRARRRVEGEEPRSLMVPIYMLVAAIIILGVYPAIALAMINPAAEQLSLLIP